MKKKLLIGFIISLLGITLYSQSRGTPSNLRVLTDANGALLIASAAQVNPLSQPTTFSNTRLATDSSGNLLVVCSGCGGGSTDNLALAADPSTSSTGIIYRGTAATANRFLHTYSGGGSATGHNIFLGMLSGNFTLAYVDANHSASDNTCLGTSTCTTLTSGASNTIIGHNAGNALTTSFQNVIIGDKAGQFIQTGDGNTIIGKDAMFLAVSTSANTAIGIGALRDQTGANANTAVGNHAGQVVTTGSANTAIGNLAMSGNNTGSGNTAVGENTLGANSIGADPGAGTAIGYQAMANVTGSSFLMTSVGYNSCWDCAGDTNSIYIGYLTTRTGGDHTNVINIGHNNSINCDNCATIGNASQTTFKPFGTIITAGGALAVANVGANSCGTTTATITGNDNAGEITVGATAGTVCRVTFAVAAPTRRMCISNDSTTTVAVRTTYVDTTHTDFTGTFTAADVVSFVCLTR